jgi:hypothetical protein
MQGVYIDDGNPQTVSSFGSTTGTHVTMATQYLDGGEGWAGLDSSGSLNGWKGSGITLSLGVPIIPTSSGSAVGTLAQGAAGAYNSYFVTLAQNLVASGQGNAFLRLGWEFDGNWFTWQATTPAAEASFATYFQQIVNSMRSVAGQSFRFVWNPDAGAFTDSGYNVALAYPGNAYVDAIGLDAYDQSWASPMTPTNAWNQTTLPTLVDAQRFAASQGKPLAICEWGVTIRPDGHGLGDDPLYVNNFTAWMKTAANNVEYESYFDANSGGVNSQITGGDFPNSLSAFTADL